VKLIWTKYYANGKVPSHRKNGSFWWRRNLNLLNSFKGIANATFGTGDTILFWKDLWNGSILSTLFPHLYSFVTQQDIIVASVLEMS
jgi:hypothetical protein